jgi:hypothetical protein
MKRQPQLQCIPSRFFRFNIYEMIQPTDGSFAQGRELLALEAVLRLTQHYHSSGLSAVKSQLSQFGIAAPPALAATR